MDKWTKGEQVNNSEPIPARKLLNLYAAFIAYTAYLKIDAIIASGEAGTTDLNSLLYAPVSYTHLTLPTIYSV